MRVNVNTGWSNTRLKYRNNSHDLGKISKGFSSPNTSYRSLERPLKVVTLGSLGKTQDGPSKLGVHTQLYSIRLFKIHVTLFRKVVDSSITTLDCSESSHLLGRSTVSKVLYLYFLSYWATPFLIPCAHAIIEKYLF